MLRWWPCTYLFHLWHGYDTLRGFIQYRTCMACLTGQKKVLDHPWRDM